MKILDCISEIILNSGNIFEVDQENVVRTILQAEKVCFLDTCFVTKSYNFKAEYIYKAFEKMAGGKEKQRIVFVITELVLYELKDSEKNELQERNRVFFEKMSDEGFSLLMLKEEVIHQNIRQFMSHSTKKWNEIFTRLIHDNIANLSFGQLIKTDKRMPYFGFAETEYNVPDDANFIFEIIAYLKNAKKGKDSLAEELIGTSLMLIFELTRGSSRNEFIFCSHDFGAVTRMNSVIRTSYPSARSQFKTINIFTLTQYMISDGIITSKEEAITALTNIMGDKVKLIIRNNLPFSSQEEELSIEETVEKFFNNEQVDLVGRKG